MSNIFAPHSEPAVYVYEAPVRLWHWVNAFAILVLGLTGYFIGSPLPTMSGEASDHFLMGYIRFAHFAAGYILLVGFLGRIYWMFVGNSHTREIFIPPVWRLGFWSGVWHELRWYLFLAKEPRKYTGHNPLAVLTMHLMFVWGTLFMIFTGFALYGEGTGPGSWAHSLFTVWLIPLFGQSMDVHTWHHFGMWWLVVFAMTHIYVAIREDIMSRQTIVSSMISGWRSFRDHRAVDDGH
ncbi:MAG: Ni/Fe-hydrogenase, b-type cytochrome subunit [Thiolinea sp.]